MGAAFVLLKSFLFSYWSLK